MSHLDLRKLVIDYIIALGKTKSAEKFGVTRQTVHNWENGASPSIEAIQIVLNEHLSMSPESSPSYEWSGQNVFILMPSYKDITIETHDTLFRNYSKYGPEKIGRLQEKNTLIEDARNALATRFMSIKHKPEWAIMVDDDMVLPCGDEKVFNEFYYMGIPAPYSQYLFIERILSHQKPLVGALYFGRNPGGKAQYAEAFESEVEDLNTHRLVRPGLKPTRWVATGAMCIHRSVFQAMMDQAPEKFPDIIPSKPDIPWAFFRRMAPGVGEDVSFCLRATACGIQPMVDTALICGHVGSTVFGPNNTQANFVRSR
jgi:transcriptional regulator with XRE-family HTH domain